MIVAVLLLAALLVRELPAGARRLRGARGPHEVRAAGARAAVRDVRPARALRCRRRPLAFGLFLGAFALTAVLVCDPRGRARLAARDLRAHDRLPGCTAASPFSVWGLYGGLHGLQQCGADRRRSLLALAARRDPSPPGSPAPGGRGRRDPDRTAARPRTLVLPLHPVVLPAGDGRAAGGPARRRGEPKPSPAAAGRGIRTCSIESARSRLEQRIRTPFSQGSSSEVSKRIGICVSERLDRQLALDADHAAARRRSCRRR